eukprot:10767908-Alexandrium_andersonii.AAC.1
MANNANWGASGAPPNPPPPVIYPTAFVPIPTHFVGQHRTNVVQALIGDPELLSYVQKYGTINPNHVG